MICPKCLTTSTSVFNSRFNKSTNQTWRRRRCDHCGFAFSTREYIEEDQYLTITAGREHTPFSRARLLLSLAHACAHLEQTADTAFHLLSTIEHKLLMTSKNGKVSKELLVATTLAVLERFDTKAYVNYLAARKQLYNPRELKRLLKKPLTH